MSNQIEIRDSKLCLSLETIIGQMNMEQKREVLAWLATDYEVVESVVNHITGNDELGWSTGDPNQRQKALTQIEQSHLSALQYNWTPWSAIKDKLKEIQSAKQVYWAIYHDIDKDLSRRVMSEFERLGIESNYTTKQAEDDIVEIKGMIEAAFAEMKNQAATL